MKQKLLLTFLTIFSIPTFAFEYTYEGQTLNYEVSDEATKTCLVDKNSNISGSVVIPETVTYNGSVYSVTEIGAYAFYLCSNLTSVTIPNSVSVIGLEAFRWCGFSTVTIPDSVTEINAYAFEGCKALVSVTIPNSVTHIGLYAFASCDNLVSVTIPDSITQIAWYAFHYCYSLKEINYATTKPVEASYDLFDKVVYDTATLNVAVGGLNAAKATMPWKYFEHIQEKDFSEIEEVETGKAAAMGYYDLSGRRYSAPRKGVNIVRYSDGTARKILVK